MKKTKKEKENNSQTNFNICLASVLVIFLGAILYVPALQFSKKEKEVIYYKIPVPVNVRISPNQNPVVVPVDFNLDNQKVAPSIEDIEKYKEYKEITITTQESFLTKDLKKGDIDPEVKKLQQYLNANGFTVAESGPGSKGNETERFGDSTHEAVIKFQEANKFILLEPIGLQKGTGVVGELTRNLINS